MLSSASTLASCEPSAFAAYDLRVRIGDDGRVVTVTATASDDDRDDIEETLLCIETATRALEFQPGPLRVVDVRLELAGPDGGEPLAGSVQASRVLSRDGIRARDVTLTLAALGPALRRCVPDSPDIPTSFDVQWVVSPPDEVDLLVEGDLPEEVRACVEGVARDATFPVTRQLTTIIVTFAWLQIRSHRR